MTHFKYSDLAKFLESFGYGVFSDYVTSLVMWHRLAVPSGSGTYTFSRTASPEIEKFTKYVPVLNKLFYSWAALRGNVLRYLKDVLSSDTDSFIRKVSSPPPSVDASLAYAEACFGRLMEVASYAGYADNNVARRFWRTVYVEASQALYILNDPLLFIDRIGDRLEITCDTVGVEESGFWNFISECVEAGIVELYLVFRGRKGTVEVPAPRKDIKKLLEEALSVKVRRRIRFDVPTPFSDPIHMEYVGAYRQKPPTPSVDLAKKLVEAIERQHELVKVIVGEQLKKVRNAIDEIVKASATPKVSLVERVRELLTTVIAGEGNVNVGVGVYERGGARIEAYFIDKAEFLRFASRMLGVDKVSIEEALKKLENVKVDEKSIVVERIVKSGESHQTS